MISHTSTNNTKASGGRAFHTRLRLIGVNGATTRAAGVMDTGRAFSGAIVFDDWPSVLHAVLGATAADAAMRRKRIPAILVAGGFAWYQLVEHEPLANKIGDFLEFAFGGLAVYGLKGALCTR